MKTFPVLLLFLYMSCASEAPVRVYEDVIEITEVNPNRLTALTKQNLFHLAKVYDLKPFLFTKKIQIQSYVVPHSHPVLTLNTRNAEKPNLLLSTWLHEELHWWTTQKKTETDLAMKELKKIWPDNTSSTNLHLIVCYLEMRALEHYLGKKDARAVLTQHIRVDKLYPWIYTQVLQKRQLIERIVKKNKLLPPPLT